MRTGGMRECWVHLMLCVIALISSAGTSLTTVLDCWSSCVSTIIIIIINIIIIIIIINIIIIITTIIIIIIIKPLSVKFASAWGPINEWFKHFGVRARSKGELSTRPCLAES